MLIVGAILRCTDNATDGQQTELGYDRSEEKIAVWLQSIHAMIRRRAHSVRLLGSAALDLCYVACGRLDGVFSAVTGEYP